MVFIPPNAPVFKTSSASSVRGNGDIVMPSIMGSAYLRNAGPNVAYFNFDSGFAVISGDAGGQLANLQFDSRVPRNITYYLTITLVAGVYYVKIYSDAGLTTLIAQGSSTTATTVGMVLEEQDVVGVPSGVSGIIDLTYTGDDLAITAVILVAIQQNGQFGVKMNESVNLDDIQYSRINFLCAAAETAVIDVIAVPRSGVGGE